MYCGARGLEGRPGARLGPPCTPFAQSRQLQGLGSPELRCRGSGSGNTEMSQQGPHEDTRLPPLCFLGTLIPRPLACLWWPVSCFGAQSVTALFTLTHTCTGGWIYNPQHTLKQALSGKSAKALACLAPSKGDLLVSRSTQASEPQPAAGHCSYALTPLESSRRNVTWAWVP